MLVRLFHRHPREWGPVEWLAVSVLGALAAAVITVMVGVVRGPGRCGADLREFHGDCVGVTAGAFQADPGVEGLIRAVAKENARVKQDWESPGSGPRIPYARIALMMPFTADEHSTMTMDNIRRGLAGALAAQREANGVGGPHYQLLLAPDGRNLAAWQSVVTRIAELAKDPRAPLVGVTGIPSSTLEMQKTIAALSRYRIPTVSPVVSGDTMKSRYFFKVSPSNDQFTRALSRYLAGTSGKQKGFLVWDNRPEDVYSQNLRSVIEKYFGAAYDLTNHNSPFVGTSGTDMGIPQRFYDAVQNICSEQSDTVFFAGRDRDLPAFIERLAGEGDCGRGKKLRILKVGNGLAPTITTDASTRRLQEADAVIVAASAVDPAWWGGKHQPPQGLGSFLDSFEGIAKQYKLGAKPLDDGYAVLYHDAFTLLVDAVDRAFPDVNKGVNETQDLRVPTKDDVYNTLVYPTIAGSSCSHCLRGAAGTYGFEGPGKNDQWAVCKPVPVLEYPAITRPANQSPISLYHTYRNAATPPCPS